MITTPKQQYNDIDNDGLIWDVIKSDLRQYIIDYSKTQAKRRQVESDLLNEYNEASKLFEANGSKINLETWKTLK